MKTNHSDALHAAIEFVVRGRTEEVIRHNRQMLNKLEAQLETQAYQILKAAAKEVSAVTFKDAERIRKEDSLKSGEARSRVPVREDETLVYSASFGPYLHPGLRFAEWGDLGGEGKIRQALSEEDGASHRTASGFGYTVALHA